MQTNTSKPIAASLNPLLTPIRGSMLGLAIGDAFGYPLEFSSQTPSHPAETEFKARRLSRFAVPSWMGGSAGEPYACALFSDDTQMAICVAEALCRAGAKEPEDSAPEALTEFLSWGYSAENTRSPGGTVMGSLRRLREDPNAKIDNGSKGCGTIMRSQPYGWFYGPSRARRTAEVHARITHGHEAPLGPETPRRSSRTCFGWSPRRVTSWTRRSPWKSFARRRPRRTMRPASA